MKKDFGSFFSPWNGHDGLMWKKNYYKWCNFWPAANLIKLNFYLLCSCKKFEMKLLYVNLLLFCLLLLCIFVLTGLFYFFLSILRQHQLAACMFVGWLSIWLSLSFMFYVSDPSSLKKACKTACLVPKRCQVLTI